MEQLFSDPLSLVMFAAIAVIIFFMFRNGKKRQEQMRNLQNNMQPGVEVMMQSGIFGTIVAVDDEANRVTLKSGDSTFVAHRNAIAQIVTPVTEEVAESAVVAPEDDPKFGERTTESSATETEKPAEGTDSSKS